MPRSSLWGLLLNHGPHPHPAICSFNISLWLLVGLGAGQVHLLTREKQSQTWIFPESIESATEEFKKLSFEQQCKLLQLVCLCELMLWTIRPWAVKAEDSRILCCWFTHENTTNLVEKKAVNATLRGSYKELVSGAFRQAGNLEGSLAILLDWQRDFVCISWCIWEGGPLPLI